MYSLVFYVPETHLETVKEAVFNAGAGLYNNYDRCSWQVKGTGQFRPLQGSDPFIGKNGQLEQVDEYRVEMICDDKYITDVVRTLIEVHPYEEPAYHVTEIYTADDLQA